jgi:hypothetical protein
MPGHRHRCASVRRPGFLCAWSVSATDAVALQQLVERDADARRKGSRRRNHVAAMLPVPGVRCVRPEAGGAGGRCALYESRTGNPAIR